MNKVLSTRYVVFWSNGKTTEQDIEPPVYGLRLPNGTIDTHSVSYSKDIVRSNSLPPSADKKEWKAMYGRGFRVVRVQVVEYVDDKKPRKRVQ